MKSETPTVQVGLRLLGVLALAGAIGLVGCDTTAPTGEAEPDPLLVCSLDPDLLVSGGVPRDAIPALSDPPLADLSDPLGSAYLADDDRVVGFHLDGVPMAVPHNILWHHEIVNLTGPETRVAVSYCPLTGSAIVFDRAVIGGEDFRVSGLLYQSNLIMFDRETDSLWPQMYGQSRCGPRDGADIPTHAAWEMTWSSWRAAYPFTKVVSDDTGWEDDYSAETYPYGDYEDPASEYWFEMPDADTRRLPKERVLGIPASEAGAPHVFPFFELDELGEKGAVNTRVQGRDIVVLWDRAAQGAAVFEAMTNGEGLRVTVGPIGDFGELGFFGADGTSYGLDGHALSGPRSGERLEPVAGAYVAFWRAWAAFHESTLLWEN